MLFDEGDDKMVKTEAFPTIRMKIDRLLKITNEYQFNDLVKAVYCINLCINNRSVLESCFFYNLPTHDKVQNDMILEMRIACGLEVKDYE